MTAIVLSGPSIRDQVSLKFLLHLIGEMKAREVTPSRLAGKLQTFRMSLPDKLKPYISEIDTSAFAERLISYHHQEIEDVTNDMEGMAKVAWYFCIGYFNQEGLQLGRHGTRRINDIAARINIPVGNAHDFVKEMAEQLLEIMCETDDERT